MDLVVTVKEIKGRCPTYKLGDSFTLKAYPFACTHSVR